MKQISWTNNKMKKSIGVSTEFLSVIEIEKAKAFHASIPEYSETPLRSLNLLAKRMGVGGIYIKDESFRFGLNAFKVLGASYGLLWDIEVDFLK